MKFLWAETALTWPNHPVGLALARFQRELYIVDSEPPRVMVTTPDGGVLRVLGQNRLQAPRHVAILNDPGAPGPTGVGPSPLRPDRVRVFVTEPSLGRVQVFNADGSFVRGIEALGEPFGAVAVRDKVYVTDSSGGRVVVLDYAGDQIDEWRLGGSGAAMHTRPESIVGVDNAQTPEDNAGTLIILDRVSNAVLWCSTAGQVQAQVALTSGGGPAVPVDLSLASFTDDRVTIVVSDRGLLQVTRDGKIVTISDIDLPAPVLAVAAYRTDRYGPRLGPEAYLAIEGQSHLRRFTLDSSDGSVQPSCPWPDDEAPTPWRIATAPNGTLFVASTNGVLQRVSTDGTFEKTMEAGNIDDFAIGPDNSVVFNVRADLMRVTSQGLTWLPAARRLDDIWHSEQHCTPAGYGVQESVDVAADGSRIDATLRGAYEGGSREDGTYSTEIWCDANWDSYILCDSEAQVTPLEQPHILTDILTDAPNGRALGVDRLAGTIIPKLGPVIGPKTTGRPWPIPGRPWRVARGTGSDTFVLTAEGFIWQVNSQGTVLNGWDAAGAPNGWRADLVDIAADTTGATRRVFALDRTRGSILVFEPGPDPAAAPKLPPPCTVFGDKDALPPEVEVGSVVTVTLRVSGSCGRSESVNDILILSPNPSTAWMKDNFREIDKSLLDVVDLTKDRLALMTMDSTGTVVVPFTESAPALRAGLANWPTIAHFDRNLQPLDFARTYFERYGRISANRILITIHAVNGYYDTVIAAERLRRARIRTIAVANDPMSGLLPANMAYQLEDLYISPDSPTLAEMYGRLGRALGVRVLARQLVVTDSVPANMDYVVDSAIPPAQWDDRTRTLTWEATDLGFGGWAASYRLQPREQGYWPTNVAALAAYVDGQGVSGQRSFPVPYLDVVAPRPTATATTTSTATVTPSATQTRPFTPVPSTSATPSAGPTRSVFLPLTLREERCDTNASTSDVVLVLDASSSMEELTVDGRSKLDIAKDAARVFLDELRLANGDQAAVVTFNDEAVLLQGLTADHDRLDDALSRIRVSQHSRLDLGIREAQVELTGTRRRAHNKAAMIVLTDGLANPTPADVAVEEARAAKAAGTIVFTIGLGDDLDGAALGTIASQPAYFYQTADPQQLATIYRSIAGVIPCPAGTYWGTSSQAGRLSPTLGATKSQ